MNCKNKIINKQLPSTGDLPIWSLEDLYKGIDDNKIQGNLRNLETQANKFSSTYKGILKNLNSIEFRASIELYELINEGLAQVVSFAQLLLSINTIDEKVSIFWQNITEKTNNIAALVLFFELEINQLDKTSYDNLFNSPVLKKYQPWLGIIRTYKKYQLANDLELLMHEKAVVGRIAWCRLFDETISKLRFKLGSRSLNCEEALNQMTDASPKVRKGTAKEIGRVLRENIGTFSLVINTLAKDKEIEDRWRGFSRPFSFRNLENRIGDGVVDTLRNTIRAAYPEFSHKYYSLKARWMGVDFLNYWDRNAPLPEEDGNYFTWGEAKQIVVEAFHKFEPTLGELAKDFVSHDWIDAQPRKGKNHGAFCHPTVPSSHPYLLMNYRGKSHDVLTLAHETGHALHQILAGKQGYLLSQTPLTLAETASIFGETLVFRSLLDNTRTSISRKILLATKIEDMLNTLFRQIAFHEFEERIHLERRNGELSKEHIAKIWISVQKESLGPIFRFDREYDYYWAYIPHFFHSPFYVYSYAFGICLVNTLYSIYDDGFPGFVEKYMQILESGGAIPYDKHLHIFGLNPENPEFWQRGLELISENIYELETLI